MLQTSLPNVCYRELITQLLDLDVKLKQFEHNGCSR